MKESENFDALRKLLALKRHEQPPPGYFDRLPDNIMARLHHGEAQNTFWEKLVSALTLKPALAYSLGLALCGVLGAGLWYSIQVQPADTALQTLPSEPWQNPTAITLASEQPKAFQAAQNDFSSTNPVTPQQPRSLFENLDLKVAPVSYDPGQ